MAFDVSALANYTEENNLPLKIKVVMGAKTASLLTPMTGIKSAKKIQFLDTDAVYQAGGTCGWNASGTTTFSQRDMVVGKIKIQEALCPKALEAKYTQILLQPGSNPEAMPEDAVYMSLKTSLIAAQNEVAIWQGDTTSGTNNLSYFDGLIKNIGKVYSSTGVLNVNAITGTGTIALVSGDATATITGGSTTTMGLVAGDKIRTEGVTYTVLSITSATVFELTANSAVSISGKAYTFIPQSSTNFTTPFTSFTGNYISIFQSIWTTIPVELLDKTDLVCFVGWDVFRGLCNEITSGKYFNYTADSAAANGEMMFPGTNLKIVAVNGLNSTSKIYCSLLSNMFLGTDMGGEDEELSIEYAKEAREVRFHCEFKMGANVGFLNQVIQFTLA